MRIRKILIIICAVFIGALLFFAGWLRTKYVAPILMYHQVIPYVEPGYKLGVSVKTFERQMRFLKEKRYRVVPLEELAKLIREKRKIPSRTVALTFDDGYRDNYLYAWPVLKKYQLPATIFLIVDEVGRPQHDRISWDEAKEMQASGLITFGSHGLGPGPLVNIKSDEELKRQIFDSKRVLEEQLARPVSIFSYPEGLFNAKIRQLVIGARYQAAVATIPGKNYPNDDYFALKRLRISQNAANLFVFAVEASGYYTFLKEYQKYRHVKK